MDLGYKKEVSYNFPTAIEKARSALSAKGFGVLMSGDVKAAIKKMLNKDFDDYIILGACKPTYSIQALEFDKEMGLLMPCNVLVYSDKGKVFVSAILPTKLFTLVNAKEVESLANTVEKELKEVIDLI